jgi:hypothetical protein
LSWHCLLQPIALASHQLLQREAVERPNLDSEEHWSAHFLASITLHLLPSSNCLSPSSSTKSCLVSQAYHIAVWLIFSKTLSEGKEELKHWASPSLQTKLHQLTAWSFTCSVYN